MPELTPYKQLIEFRTRLKLNFFTQMDHVGEQLLDKYPDWQRTGLFLELQNRETRTRIHLSAGRVLFESDGDAECQKQVQNEATSVLKNVIKELNWDALTRIGLRRWFAISLGLTPPATALRFRERFLKLPKLTHDGAETHLKLELGVRRDDDPDEGERGCITVGTMVPTEWTTYVPYPEPPTHLGPAGIKPIIDSLPNSFVFLDHDLLRFSKTPSISAPDAIKFLGNAFAQSTENSKRLTGALK